MPGYTGTSGSNFPQISKNRTFDSWAVELTEYTGGEDRPDIIRKAESTIRATIKRWNDVYWSFNVVTEDIALASPVSGTIGEYDLSSDWKGPLRAQLVDSNSKTRDHITWVEWKEWISNLPDQSSTAGRPTMYTARSVFRLGRIIIDPPKASTLTYPTLRLFYFKRIACPSGNAAVEVPEEVEQAMFDDSVYQFLAKIRSFKEASNAKRDALISRQMVEREYRDYKDYTHG